MTNDEDALAGQDAPHWNEPPTRAVTRAYTGQDRDVGEYLRAPYDPLLCARMEGKVIGHLLRRLWHRLARSTRRPRHD